jgi:hypothetical protein
MAIFTHYIENKDYNAREVIEKWVWYNAGKEFLASLAHVVTFPISFPLLMYYGQWVYDSRMFPQEKYTGVELTNFINELSELSPILPWYSLQKGDLILKLAAHEFDKTECLTYDDYGWFNWPGAVLKAHKEDLPAYKNGSNDLADEALPLVQAVSVAEDSLSG